MADVPETSTTLLRDLTSGTNHPRWEEFVARYRPIMEAFLHIRFPGLDAEDIIQETLMAFVNAIPDYQYVPDEKGYFHNYLTGILNHKALGVLRDRKSREVLLHSYQEEPSVRYDEEAGTDTETWRKALYEIALQQVMADPRIADRSKEIFSRTAINGERPEAVAASLAMNRNAVDQAKWRVMQKLRQKIEDLKHVGVR